MRSARIISLTHTPPTHNHSNLSGKNLKGSLPQDATWAAFPGLSVLNAASSGLLGAVPPTLASLPALTSVDLSSNPYVCGTVPDGLSGKLNSQGTAIGITCDDVVARTSTYAFCVCTWAPGSSELIFFCFFCGFFVCADALSFACDALP